ncbi:hypothetical protein GCM10017567_76370 [Amycolatopsis bullii]|uniref:Uncharacterized protein n=1 Tax=Amycolatopsis bullii TaxID=941987 RepID=A0ABQ3KPB3_9PSEU|nr:hypothetical protein GCM10017567_76370 [Amycolatopsis bullii]
MTVGQARTRAKTCPDPTGRGHRESRRRVPTSPGGQWAGPWGKRFHSARFPLGSVGGLGEALNPPPGARMPDLAGGSGELLCTWARDHRITTAARGTHRRFGAPRPVPTRSGESR